MNNPINQKYQLAIDELYRAKDFFLDRFCDEDRVKEAKVFITIQTGKKNHLGHFWAQRWDFEPDEEEKELYHEINISAEYLNRPINDIFETFLHELSHMYNNVLGIEDCNAAQYHNKNFKKAAEKFGLIVDKYPGRGWALTSLSEEGIAAVEAFEPKKDVLKFCRIMAEPVKKENPYITINLKREDWEDTISEKLEELGMEKPKELVVKLLEEMM